MKYTWEQFFKDADLLARKVKGNNFEALLIITKGGLFFGSYLAERLNIPVVETIGVKSYKAGEKIAMEIIKEADFLKLPPRLLIVDDISDTGETLRYVQDKFKAPTVTLFKKKGTKCQPTFCVNEIADNVWVEFPWETFPDLK